MTSRFSNLEFEDDRQQSETVEEGLQSDACMADHFLDEAGEQYRWGRFDVALRLYTRALTEDRTLVAAWVGQVQMLVQLDECHEARVWSDKALELFRNHGNLLAAKAQACVRLHDTLTAQACSDASLQAPGMSAWRWLVRGEILLAKGEKYYEECFQKALNEATSNWFDRVMVGRVYLFYERVTNALCYLKEALALQPTHGYTWFEIGNCQNALSLTSAAQDSYRRCLDLRPDYQEAELALGNLASRRSVLSSIQGMWRRWRRQ